MGALAERSGLDGEGLVGSATSDLARDVGPLSGLADELRLSVEQKGALAMAYVLTLLSEERPKAHIKAERIRAAVCAPPA